MLQMLGRIYVTQGFLSLKSPTKRSRSVDDAEKIFGTNTGLKNRTLVLTPRYIYLNRGTFKFGYCRNMDAPD